jgi:hypothetical protein
MKAIGTRGWKLPDNFQRKKRGNPIFERGFLWSKSKSHKKKPGKRRPKPPFPGAKPTDKESDQ